MSSERHDLKNELHAIRMGLILMRQLFESSPTENLVALQEVAGRIESCVDRIDELVDHGEPSSESH
jgi:signal transduction histidine kinase